MNLERRMLFDRAARSPYKINTILGGAMTSTFIAITKSKITYEDYLFNDVVMQSLLIVSSSLLFLFGFTMWNVDKENRDGSSADAGDENAIREASLGFSIVVLCFAAVILYAGIQGDPQSTEEYLGFSGIYGLGIGSVAGLSAYTGYHMMKPK